LDSIVPAIVTRLFNSFVIIGSNANHFDFVAMGLK
jgi:hypothetical protein